jgi:hypothetical protein
VGTPPVLKREILNGESRHGLVLKEETVVHLVVALKVDGCLSPNERAIVNGVLLIKGQGKHRQLGATGGGEEGDTV